jgi:hypothetical protein
MDALPTRRPSARSTRSCAVPNRPRSLASNARRSPRRPREPTARAEIGGNTPFERPVLFMRKKPVRAPMPPGELPLLQSVAGLADLGITTPLASPV